MLMWCWDTTSFAIFGVSVSPLESESMILTESPAEKHPADNGSGFAVRYKFAFQYCGEGDPWWTKCVGFPCEFSFPLYLRYVAEFRSAGTVSPPATDGTKSDRR